MIKNEIKNKKGELTTKQLVTIIILIVSFIIVLFLIFRLNLGQQTDKEICRNSVVLQQSAVSGPLDCRTSYVTIEAASKEDVMKAIADEMASCWYIFGEGRINYGTPQGTSIKYALCSIIEFDSKVQQEIPEITYSEFYDYLKTTPKEGSQSYLNYLYGVNDVNSLVIQSQFRVNITQDKIRTNQRHSIITGIDDNISPFPDEIFKVYIIPTSETSARLEEGEFLTKA